MPVMEQRPLAITQEKDSASANLSTANLSTLAFTQRSLAKAIDTDAEDEKVCWIEAKEYPYQPDHQVELLHLQAEADALLIKLQTREQKQLSEKAAL